MIQVELRTLLGRLDPSCTRAMEAAAGLCVSRGHYEVTTEHTLLKLLDDPDGDVQLVLQHFDVDVARLQRSLERAVDELRMGNPGKPVLSPLLVEWLADAWLLASLDFGMTTIRSGLLALALAARSRRYLSADVEELEKLAFDALHRSLREIVAASAEEEQTAVVAPAQVAGGGTPRDKRKDGALARFATNLTQAGREKQIDPVFGRDKEIRQIVDILARRRKNNPIIVGEAGVGKTAVVEGLALRIAEQDVPDLLLGVDIWALDLGLLQAGAGVKGEFEARLKAVIDEVKGATRKTILFIDEAHTLIGAGAAQGSGDAANLLKPALARGELRTIAATTWAEYKKYFEEDAALARRFQPVIVDEPSAGDAAVMLRGLRPKYEAVHGVVVREDAIAAATHLAARYIAGRLLPDKAVDLLDTAAARVKIGLTAKPGAVDDLERAIGAIDREIAGLVRDQRGGRAGDPERVAELQRSLTERRAALEEVLGRWSSEKRAVARVAALRSAPAAGDEPPPELASALEDLRRLQGDRPLVRLEVDPDAVAQIVADWTGVPVGRMLTNEAEQVRELEARLSARIRGQDQALAIVGRALRDAKVGLKDPSKPQVFLLVGPSGVGKTELGLTVAETLFGGERFAVSINMSEYQDREMGVSGLIGAKPGYVGYGKGGVLTEAVRQRPYSVVLLDEIEKCCQEARNLFYQVFDKGDLVDGTGRRIDFKNTVVFMTTNLTADVIQRMCAAPARPDGQEIIATIRPLLSQALQPAWLARTTIVPFLPLEQGALIDIARMKLARVGARLRDAHRVELVVDESVPRGIAERCADVETGARNIDFILGSALLPLISSEILTHLADGALPPRMFVELDARNDVSVRFGG
ncbi:MAG: type VI secretion system ATPase TssH [Polyangiaceae bacterium]